MSIVSQSFHSLFNGDSVVTATEYTYNSTGWISARSNELTLQTCVATMGVCATTGIQWRLEGKFDLLDRAASLYYVKRTEADSIDKIYRIPERVKYLRLGVKFGSVIASPLASQCIVYAGLCRSEYT